MKDNCLDIGVIQAFLDGELSHAESTKVSSHVALCDACATMLAEAEDEAAFVFPVLEREMNSLVPTQRLWSKINDSIEADRRNRPVWEKILSAVRISLVNPSLVAAAGLLIVFGLVATMWLVRTPMPNSNELALDGTMRRSSAPASSVATLPQPSTGLNTDTGDRVVTSLSSRPVAQRASFRPQADRVSSPAPKQMTSPAVVTAAYLPGEGSYVKTIATLERTVDEQKAAVMRPSERIAFERDLAVVNDAIGKLKREIRRNPKNESAKQVLYSAYQNKIDLLNSVSQKGDLVASLD
jgi:hypothetical protein